MSLELLFDDTWLRANEAELRELLPETWTHLKNINALRLVYRLKLLGINWRSDRQFGMAMACLIERGVLLQDGHKFRRNPHSVFRSSR